MVQKDPGGGDGREPHAPYKPPVGKSTVTSTPGLLTSTGGLLGGSPLLLMPIVNTKTGRPVFVFIDPNNFDTEEAVFYQYRQEDVQPNRKVSIHRLVVTYRELGKATAFFGIVAYIMETDNYIFKEAKLTIAPTKSRNLIADPFPSGKLRSQKLSLVITGERPQLYWRRDANSGPLSVTRVLMAGKSDEKDQL
jgi:hypothetical protein